MEDITKLCLSPDLLGLSEDKYKWWGFVDFWFYDRRRISGPGERPSAPQVLCAIDLESLGKRDLL